MATSMMASNTLLAPRTCRVSGQSLRAPVAVSVPRAQRLVVRAEAAEAKPKEEKKEEKKPWSPPPLDSSWPSPIFGGSTGGLMRNAQVKRLQWLHSSWFCIHLHCCQPSWASCL